MRPTSFPGVAGPPPVAMLGLAPQALRDPLRFLESMTRRYGRTVALPAGPGVLVVAEPDAVQDVLLRRSRDFGRATPQYAALSAVTGDGLLVLDPPRWREHRRVLQPAFHHSITQRVIRQTEQATQDVLERVWRPGVRVDVGAAMDSVANAVVRRVLFGRGPQGSVDRLVRATLQAADAVVRPRRSPLRAPRGVPTSANRAATRASHELDQAVTALLDVRATMPTTPTEPLDVLDLLLAAQRAGTVDGTAVRDELVTMVVAGQETVATGLTWAWQLIGEHPEVLAALAAPGEDRDALTDAVVAESLRLYPPAWVLSRRAVVDTIVGGIPVEAGAIVVISPYLLHRDPGFWAGAAAFRPGRWLDSPAPEPGSHLPFGLGARMCVGRDTALLVARTVVSTTVRHLDGRSVEAGPRPACVPRMTLRPASPVHLSTGSHDELRSPAGGQARWAGPGRARGWSPRRTSPGPASEGRSPRAAGELRSRG